MEKQLLNSSLACSPFSSSQTYQMSGAASFFFSLFQYTTNNILSLLGSGIIVRFIIQDFGGKMTHVYHRLLFVMSVIDILNSLNSIFGFLAVPKNYFWGSIGNTTTCNASGFLFEFGTAVGMYNLGLSLYYFLSLRSHKRKNRRLIVLYVEPLIHGCCILIPLGMGLWAWLVQSLNPLRSVGGWCYIYKFPPTCTLVNPTVAANLTTAATILSPSSEFQAKEELISSSSSSIISCMRGNSWELIGFISVVGKGLPVWIGILVLMYLIWHHVRKQEKAVQRYRTSREITRTRQAFE